jgi:hypothetical protein
MPRDQLEDAQLELRFGDHAATSTGAISRGEPS